MNLPKTAPAETGSEMIQKLLVTHEKAIYNIALRITKDPIAAEDLAQEARIRMWRFRDGFDYRGDTAFRSWARQIMRNILSDQARKKDWIKRTPLDPLESDPGLFIPDPSPSPAKTVEMNEIIEAVESALPQLTNRQRECFALYRLGTSQKETGRILGLAEGTVKSHLDRARKKILAHLKKHGLL